MAGVPPGVFSVVTGDRDAGAALSNHPSVAMISFTGSSATGSKIMQSCAPRLAQSMLELGGKSALVVFPDVSVDDAVVTTMRGMLANGGQGGNSINIFDIGRCFGCIFTSIFRQFLS